jgi:hypothetical protein
VEKVELFFSPSESSKLFFSGGFCLLQHKEKGQQQLLPEFTGSIVSLLVGFD